jgi:hypothetical protein
VIADRGVSCIRQLPLAADFSRDRSEAAFATAVSMRCCARRALYTEVLEHIRKSDLGDTENLRVASAVRRQLAYILSCKDVLERWRNTGSAAKRMSAWWPPIPKDLRARMNLAVVMRDAGELQEGLPNAAAATASYRKVLEQLVMLDATVAETIVCARHKCTGKVRLATVHDPARMEQNHL